LVVGWAKLYPKPQSHKTRTKDLFLRVFMAAGSDETSGYINSILSVINGCYFMAGFTFTVITLLLAQLKDSTAMFSQVVLFLLNILLGLSISASWQLSKLRCINANLADRIRQCWEQITKAEQAAMLEAFSNSRCRTHLLLWRSSPS
jgi:hypothetical protein